MDFKSSVTLTSCTLSSNRASVENGGAMHIGDDGSSATLTMCTVINNSAGRVRRQTVQSDCVQGWADMLRQLRGLQNGGAMNLRSSSATLTSCTISNNRAGDVCLGHRLCAGRADMLGCGVCREEVLYISTNMPLQHSSPAHSAATEQTG